MKKIILLISLIFSTSLYADWRVSIDKDEMTGEFSAYASSLSVKPTKIMRFPYSSISAWLGVGCDKKESWVYIGFNEAPNLSDTKTYNGYNEIHTRIKFDDIVDNYSLTQKWGSRFLHFNFDSAVIKKLKNSNTMLLELNWYGNGSTYFKFPLNGSTAAINNAFRSCGISTKD